MDAMLLQVLTGRRNNSSSLVLIEGIHITISTPFQRHLLRRTSEAAHLDEYERALRPGESTGCPVTGTERGNMFHHKPMDQYGARGADDQRRW
jgi:hypothetical protein